MINGQRLNAACTVEIFTYLGSTLSTWSRNIVLNDEHDEVNTTRLAAKASAAFGRLTKSEGGRGGHYTCYRNQDQGLQSCCPHRSPIHMIHAIWLWNVDGVPTPWKEATYNHFHTTILRRIFSIKWQDRVPKTEVFSWAGLPSIHTILIGIIMMQAQLRWAGHVACMPDHRLPKKLLFRELQKVNAPKVVKRSTSKTRSKLHWMPFGVDYSKWEQETQDRDEWRAKI